MDTKKDEWKWIISHLNEQPGQPKASRTNAPCDSQGLLFSRLAKALFNTSIHISHSCFGLMIDYEVCKTKS